MVLRRVPGSCLLLCAPVQLAAMAAPASAGAAGGATTASGESDFALELLRREREAIRSTWLARAAASTKAPPQAAVLWALDDTRPTLAKLIIKPGAPPSEKEIHWKATRAVLRASPVSIWQCLTQLAHMGGGHCETTLPCACVSARAQELSVMHAPAEVRGAVRARVRARGHVSEG